MLDQKCQPFSSGNPVFDAFVTIVCMKHSEMDIWEDIHSKLLTLAEKEPGGLHREAGMLPAESLQSR